MTTQSSPVITDMKVIPVAGHDSMLLNIGGAHNAYFTRNIVVLTDNAGNTGVGEAPGGEVIYQTLVDAIPMVLGQEVARLNKVVQQVHKGNQAADFFFCSVFFCGGCAGWWGVCFAGQGAQRAGLRTVRARQAA